MTVRSRQVSGELRRLRKRADLTSGQVGERLGISQSKVSRIENGQIGLRLGEVAAMLGLYQADAACRDRLLALVDQAGQSGLVEMHGGSLPEQWQQLIEWEAEATRLLSYEPLTIPGLLQSTDYARAVIRDTAVRSRTEAEVDNRVSARIGRQALLSRTLPPEFHVVLTEPALRLPVGSHAIMAAELRAVLEAARRPTVTVQIVPLAVGPHPGLEGPFMIMEFANDPTLVYLENRAVSIFLEDEPHIEVYRLAWQAILAKALTPKRSLEVIATAQARHDKELHP
jgi:transcriptional regulator with XRE-family HTH domain